MTTTVPKFVETEPYKTEIRIRSLWPPGLALNREVLALLPQNVCKDIVLVTPEELYRDGDGKEPCYVLGPCVFDGVNYVPAEKYQVKDIIGWTKRFSGPQKDTNKRQAERNRKAKLNEAAEQEKAERWRKAELAKAEKEAKSSPAARLKELEEKVRTLQSENQSLLATASGYVNPEQAPQSEES